MRVRTTTEYSINWATIKAAVDKGRAREVLHSGDQIFTTLKNGEDVSFDVTYDATGKLFLVMHDCMKKEHYMNKLWTNAGGWRDCDMRRYLNETVFELLPDDLKSCIKPTTITQVIDGQTVTCTDNLFLLSLTQVLGKGFWSDKESEDSQLDIFKTERDRVKLCDGYTSGWWLRSANGATFSTMWVAAAAPVTPVPAAPVAWSSASVFNPIIHEIRPPHVGPPMAYKVKKERVS